MSEPLAGPIPTLWASDGQQEAFDGAEALLRQARPPVVQLHTWEPEHPARWVREILPGVAIVVGCGVDGIARRVALGEWSVSRGVLSFRRLAERAEDCGAVAVCWNAEGGWKRPPSSPEAARLRDVIAGALSAVASERKTLRQWHTAYDHPSYHSAYPWRAWLGPGSPVEVSLPQVYAAPAGGVMAHRGALPRREARALASWAAAIRAGWITPDDPSTPLREGVLWRPYYQLHHVATADTVAGAVSHPLACLWALPTRADEPGRLAFRSLCELWRRGLWGEDAVRRFQAGAGLVADGVCGPLTLAALGVVG